MMKKRATESRLWEALVPNFEDLLETMMHVLVRSDRLSSRGMVATGNVAAWPDFLKKQATISSCALRDLLSLGGGDSSGTARPLTAFLFSDHMDRSEFRHQSSLPRPVLNGLR